MKWHVVVSMENRYETNVEAETSQEASNIVTEMMKVEEANTITTIEVERIGSQ